MVIITTEVDFNDSGLYIYTGNLKYYAQNVLTINFLSRIFFTYNFWINLEI